MGEAFRPAGKELLWPPAPSKSGHCVLKPPAVAWGQICLDGLGENSLAARDLRVAAGNQDISSSLGGAWNEPSLENMEEGGCWRPWGIWASSLSLTPLRKLPLTCCLC